MRHLLAETAEMRREEEIAMEAGDIADRAVGNGAADATRTPSR